MSIDRKILHITNISLFALLLVGFFLPSSGSRIYVAVLLPTAAVVIHFLLKKRTAPSFYYRQVTGLMAVMGVFYVSLQFVAGIYFGLGHSVKFSGVTLFLEIIPIILGVLAIEYLRSIIIVHKGFIHAALIYVISVMADVLIFANVSSVDSFNELMDVFGITLMPAIIANLVYQYISKRYTWKPNVIYRLIVVLQPYFIPRIPLMSTSLQAIIKLLFPLLIFAFIDGLYEKKRKYALVKHNVFSYLASAVTVVIMIGIVMLTSCQFRFGALVIATESMTGELNKGDTVIYEQYDDQIIEKGQVIVFKKGQSRIVHRVVDIERVNGQNRYYTKGDANGDLDAGYVTDADIVGTAELKVPYVGYPTLWIRELVIDKLFN